MRLEHRPPAIGKSPPDRAALRILVSFLSSQPFVEKCELVPDTYEPQSIHVAFDTTRYTSTVEAATLDIQWYTDSAFRLEYTESIPDGTERSRYWDRSPKVQSHTRPGLQGHEGPDEPVDVDRLVYQLPPRNPISVVIDFLADIEGDDQTADGLII